MKSLTMAVAMMAGMAAAQLAFAQAVVGQAAPAFSAPDAAGKTVALADFKGKYVVLEWLNPECPFSQKHYATGNMPATQKRAADKGAVWLTINTSEKGASDTAATSTLAAWVKEKKATPTAIVIDGGSVGKAYGARTTPHLYLIDPKGTLVYAGAIDSKASSNPAHIPGATNYLSQALEEAVAGKPVSLPVTKPYGCSVKYGKAG